MGDKLRPFQRLLIALASLLLLGVYFFPLWYIKLWAPQYPEWLGMFIWVNTITGENPHDLYNINILNHYIGMQEINPDIVPELKILPFIFAFFIIFGLIVAITGKKKLLKIWVWSFIIFGVLAIADFWWWEYRYGHNLDPRAPIKIPGGAYQPPLLGCKQLLNFKACSFPARGAYFAVASLILGFTAYIMDFFKKPEGRLT
ncbi:MAG TPA: hypothetical protein EYP32_05665 [Aquificaceae bacterium]|nr:hypothetical protein [Aquificaceae bacterium]HIQ48434.1 hypothetical protein [Aquifex aeolicus]